jgi:hypothetical protein
MPRGSKPGERRGGRKRATPNKRTVLIERILAIASANPTAVAHELLLNLVDDPALPADTRLAVARKLFQADCPGSFGDRSKKSNALKYPPMGVRDGKPAEEANETSLAPKGKTLVPKAEPATFATLGLLLRIAQDPTAAPVERRKAASEVAQHFLPKKIGPKKSRRPKFPPDEYGFSVDPNLARELRDTELKLACLPVSSTKLSPYAIAQRATKLQARIKEIQETLQCPCPSKYRLKYYVDRAEVDAEIVWDNDRLKILGKRRADKKMFTPVEDLEEAIRTARYDSFMQGPEMAARRRLADLLEAKRAADKGYGSPLSAAQAADFRLLTLLYPSPKPPERTEIMVVDHPFLNLPIAEDINLPSTRSPRRPASSSPKPDLEDELLDDEIVGLPPYCTIDRELSEKRGRTILKWTFET